MLDLCEASPVATCKYKAPAIERIYSMDILHHGIGKLPGYAANRSIASLFGVILIESPGPPTSLLEELLVSSLFFLGLLRHLLLHSGQLFCNGRVARSELERFLEAFDGLIIVFQALASHPFPI